MHRYVFAVSTGLFVTTALLLVMDLLIDIQPGALVDPRPRAILDIVRIDRETEVKVIEHIPTKEWIEPPVIPPREVPSEAPTSNVSIPVMQPPAPTGPGKGVDLTMTDGPLVAIVRVQPMYPARPLAIGLEGYVVVQFDVTAEGAVANAIVLESSSSLFEQSALQAIYKFRYKPRVVDGVALPTDGLRNRFTFEIEN